MKRKTVSLLSMAAILVSVYASTDAIAQQRIRYPDSVPSLPERTDRQPIAPNRDDADSSTPLTGVSTKMLMQTERGRELLDQLRVLLVSESTMGEKHPLYTELQREIKETRGLLRNLALSRKIADEIEEESKEVKRYASALPAMQDKDLRRLILRLIIRVDDLEKEVRELREQQTDHAKRADRSNGGMENGRAGSIGSLPKPLGKPILDAANTEAVFEENPFLDE